MASTRPRSSGSFLQRATAFLSSLIRTPEPVNPSRFNDPLALRVEWTPLASGGANFRTHKLRAKGALRLEFCATGFALAFCGIFIAFGIVFLAVFGASIAGRGLRWKDGEILAVIIPALFILIGGFLLRHYARPLVFDKTRSLHWRGNAPPRITAAAGGKSAPVPFDAIHALQIISEYVQGNKTSYYSYELNLVLENGSRVNVTDHGSLNRLREDARKLSAFLGKPLWDATDRGKLETGAPE